MNHLRWMSRCPAREGWDTRDRLFLGAFKVIGGAVQCGGGSSIKVMAPKSGGMTPRGRGVNCLKFDPKSANRIEGRHGWLGGLRGCGASDSGGDGLGRLYWAG